MISVYITMGRVNKNYGKELANAGGKRFVFWSGC